MTKINISENISCTKEDINAISKAITDYMLSWYGGGYQGLAEAIHPSIHKRVFRYNQHTGNPFLSEVNYFQLLETARNTEESQNPAPKSEWKNDISILHTTDRIASARSEGNRWVDYLHLARLEGRWQIMHILFDNHTEGTFPTDHEPIIKAVEDYIMPFYTSEWERLANTLHPAVIKRGFNKNRTSGRWVITNSPYSWLVEAVHGASTQNFSTPENERVCKIEIQDMFQNTASVKAVGSTWIDYIHLQYLYDEWKIIHIFYDQL